MNKQRYEILDGLRGVAALMVLLYHVFNDAKCFYVCDEPVWEFYHGFLGVDFFFLLSGFVMGYAYDSQWERMSIGDFVKRRLIRLHPMVVVGVLLGVAAFVVQGCVKWDGTAVTTEGLMLVTLLGLFLIPSPTTIEVRGYTEAFPLNGPHWSLFFEYLGSLLYALMLRKLSTTSLKVWVGVSFVLLSVFAITMDVGGVAYGWSSEPMNLLGGALRMLYAYPAGLLMARIFLEADQRPLGGHVFLFCALELSILLAMPLLSGRLLEITFQLLCIVFFFPTIVWLGARGSVSGWRQKVVCFIGRLSYPLYAVHYPFVYLFITWVGKDEHPYQDYFHPWIPLLATVAASVVTATLLMLFYDEPLRRKLSSMVKKPY